MLGWVERVVPQPPGGSPIHQILQKGSPARTDARAGLAGQPPDGSPRRPAAGSNQGQAAESQDAVSTTESVGQGVLNWLSQGLGKVIPQPVHNESPALPAVGKSFEASFDVPDVTEVQSIKLDDDDFEVTVLEPDEEEDLSELQSSSDNNAPDKMGGQNVLSWLKQGFGKMIPKPENLKRTEGETAEQVAEPERERPSQKLRLLPSPPSATEAKHWDPAGSLSSLSLSLFPRSLGGDGGSLYEWFVHELGKVMPQPVTPMKQVPQKIMQAADMGSGQERCKGA